LLRCQLGSLKLPSLYLEMQQAQCHLNPVSGATEDRDGVDPVTGNPVPLICSNFDAHKM
jgi:hypothetical protein